MLAGVPIMGGMGILMAIIMKKGVVENMKAYAQSAGYAD